MGFIVGSITGFSFFCKVSPNKSSCTSSLVSDYLSHNYGTDQVLLVVNRCLLRVTNWLEAPRQSQNTPFTSHYSTCFLHLSYWYQAKNVDLILVLSLFMSCLYPESKSSQLCDRSSCCHSDMPSSFHLRDFHLLLSLLRIFFPTCIVMYVYALMSPIQNLSLATLSEIACLLSLSLHSFIS